MSDRLNSDPLPWLLEPDEANPGVRYFTLRDVLNCPADDPEVVAAQGAVMRTGPVPAIVGAQYPEGYWVKPGPGYSPKYRATLWQVLFLAQLGLVLSPALSKVEGEVEGADGHDGQVRRAVEHVFAHAQAQSGAFSVNGRPGGAIHCLWGNVVRALLDLGYWGDERLDRAIDGLARSVTGDGYEWYRRSGVQAPGFVCAGNYGLPCAWGAVRALWALNRVPAAGRTPAVEAAIEACADFLLSYDIARADYPYHERISSSWFKFGYPLGYVTDVLLNLEALVEAGYGGDPRLDEAIELVLSKQDERGRWKMEYSYNGKMWADVEKKGQPSKWVTLRAVRVLKMFDRPERKAL
ncbi:MAG: nitrogen fixation protein NifH [Anaerolineae bacterium]